MSSPIYNWEHADISKPLPKRAVLGGCTTTGEEIYVGRAMSNGFLVPAKIVPSKSYCFVSHNGKEFSVETFEYLVGKERYFEWRPAANGNIVNGAIATGSLGTEQLYIGRACYNGSMEIGKIHPSQKCLFISHEGKEVQMTSYEVLVWTKIEKESKKYEQKKAKAEAKKKKMCKKKSLSSSYSDSDSDWSDCSIS
ncbi:hypothetical protein PVAND_001688 [Polypedilum vanderplanki]|uniref:Uncharacterized protein n=1 Tax=Polypedilum vanderplanki TaxID=319348 RepID=A0A9J6BQ04_POLVA|nr:hypothetical protein PVAND_001688 [Polypedilum vanderplanki]